MNDRRAVRITRGLALAWLLAVAVPLQAREVPIRDFARLADYTEAKISPTGEFLAVSVPQGDETGLAIIRLADMKLAGGARGGAKTHVHDFWWVSPERVLVTLARQLGPLDEKLRSGEMMAVTADGSDPQYLFGAYGGRGTSKRRRGTQENAYAELVGLVPADTNRVLVSIRHWYDDWSRVPAAVFSLALDSGETQWVTRAPLAGEAEFVADDQGQVRYFVGTDEDSLAPHTFMRDPEANRWQEVAPPRRGESRWPLRVTSDGAAVYQRLLAGTDTHCLSQLDPATGKDRTLACHPEADLAHVVFSADRNVPLAAMFASGIPEFRWVNPKHPDAVLLAKLVASFPGQVVVPTSWSKDGARLVFLVYSDRNPGEYYLYERATGTARFLVAQHQWINPKEMAEVRPVRLASRDGATLHGFLTLPPGLPPEKLPLVVYPHGGPFGVRDVWGWNADAQLLASRGYAVLQVNFRGSGGYGFKHEDFARKSWGTVMIDDITDAVRWTIKQGMADPGRICIYGASYGGYAALMSAVREPDLYRCVVGYVGVYDLPKMKSDTDVKRARGGRNFLDMYLGADDKVLAEQSPINHLDRLKAPVFIIHGEQDVRAPYNQAKLLRKALEKRRHPFEWLVRSEEGHGFYKESHRVDLYEKLLAFLDRHIGAARDGEPNATTR